MYIDIITIRAVLLSLREEARFRRMKTAMQDWRVRVPQADFLDAIADNLEAATEEKEMPWGMDRVWKPNRREEFLDQLAIESARQRKANDLMHYYTDTVYFRLREIVKGDEGCDWEKIRKAQLQDTLKKSSGIANTALRH